MTTLRQKQYDELRERLAGLGRGLGLRWPAPAEARDEEVGVTAYRTWAAGRPVLSLAVACSLRLLPVLRQHGYHWTLRRADTGERVAGGRVVGRLGVEVPDLAEGEYTLDVGLPEGAPARDAGVHGRSLGPVEWRLPLVRLAAMSRPDPTARPTPDEVVAEFHSPAADSAAGTRSVQLRRSANAVLTLWVELTGQAAPGRLARFTVHSPPGVEPWQVTGFVGTDEQGIGEVNLSALDYRLQWKLSPDCTVSLEPLWPEDLGLDDHPAVERSRDAAGTGREALERALGRLTGGAGP